MSSDSSPAKRQKTEPALLAGQNALPHLTLTSLLLSLPCLLLHPPTHTNHQRSLVLSYHALKKCTIMTSLDRVVECRAATGLAELGLQIGLSAPGIIVEIQKAITKGSLITQKLPSLCLYRHRLCQLSFQLSLESGNFKAAQSNLKRALAVLTDSDPPHVVYTFHLALIAGISSQNSDKLNHTVRSLGAIGDLHDCALRRGDKVIAQMATVLRLRAVMRAGLWCDVKECLDTAEAVLDMQGTLKGLAEDKAKPFEKPEQLSLPSPPSSTTGSRSIFEYALIVHTLILGIIFHTYTGDSGLTSPRLKWLHELLDTHLHQFPKTGIFEIPFSNRPALFYQLTHPRVVYVLGFLVSSLAKRDLVGRKPKKKVFASEGITAVDKEMKKEIAFPPWAVIPDARNIDFRLKRLRTDLICELICASIMRSEFDEARRMIDETISYTRTQNIFSSYAARLTLHEAQLAHALNKPDRALQCYQIAAWLSRKRNHHSSVNARSKSKPMSVDINSNQAAEDTNIDGEEDLWLNTAARAGELWLRIGILRQTPTSDMIEEAREKELNQLRKIGEIVTQDCRGLGGTLDTIAEVLDSCLTTEFVKAKTHLRRALNLSTISQDNHLRALVLSLIASHYLHTSNEHAKKMLETAENLAAGLGTQPKLSKVHASPTKSAATTVVAVDTVGNAHLRLWIGERFLELYNRTGDKEAAKVQTYKNTNFMEAVTRVEARR